jgi:hypothetical protein
MTVTKKGLEAKVQQQRAGAKAPSKGKNCLLDLRIHTPASIGYLSLGGIDTAPALVRLAKIKGLDMIGLTDFYSAAFIDRVAEAAKATDLKVLPGTVIRCRLGSCDDCVLTCLFPESCTSVEVQSFLSELAVPASAAGDRRYIVEKPFKEVLASLEKRGGISLPSRMDKTPHRLACLVHLVEEWGFRAFDLAYPDSAKMFRERWPRIKFNLFCFSNAHALAQVGSRMAKVKLSEVGFAGIKGMVERSTVS